MNTINNANNVNFTAKYLGSTKISLPCKDKMKSRAASFVELDLNNENDCIAIGNALHSWDINFPNGTSRPMIEDVLLASKEKQPYRFFALTTQKKSLSNDLQSGDILSITSISETGMSKRILNMLFEPLNTTKEIKNKSLSVLKDYFIGTRMSVFAKKEDIGFFKENGFKSMDEPFDFVMHTPNE